MFKLRPVLLLSLTSTLSRVGKAQITHSAPSASFFSKFSFMGQEASMSMVTKEEALPGRDKAEELSNKHVVTGNPYQGEFAENLKTAVFANGCYWGSEKGFWKLPGVYSTAVGYAGGFTPNPTYNEACSGRTGHTEGVFVVYDPEKISYSDLLRQFWESHDPSQYMGQGNDRGTQYRSAIYTNTDLELAAAEASKAKYAEALGRQIHTEIRPMSEAGPFYYAHEAYQQYLARPSARPYCSAQPQGISLPPFEEWATADLKDDDSFKPKLPDEYWERYGPKPGCTIKGKNDQNIWPIV